MGKQQTQSQHSNQEASPELTAEELKVHFEIELQKAKAEAEALRQQLEKTQSTGGDGREGAVVTQLPEGITRYDH